MKKHPLWKIIRARKIARFFKKKRLRDIRHNTKKLMHYLSEGSLDFFDYLQDNA